MWYSLESSQQGNYDEHWYSQCKFRYATIRKKISLNPCPPEPGYTLLCSVDPDQLASSEANWFGSALFVIQFLNFYRHNWIYINILDQIIWILKIRSGQGISIYSAWQVKILTLSGARNFTFKCLACWQKFTDDIWFIIFFLFFFPDWDNGVWQFMQIVSGKNCMKCQTFFFWEKYERFH